MSMVEVVENVDESVSIPVERKISNCLMRTISAINEDDVISIITSNAPKQAIRKTLDLRIISGQIACDEKARDPGSSNEEKSRPRVSIRKLMSLFNTSNTSPDRQMTEESSHKEPNDVYDDYFNTMYGIAVENEIDTIRCVAAVVISLINSSHGVDTTSPAYTIFLDNPESAPPPLPSIHAVQAFITELYKYAQLEFESLIVALIYIDRLRLTSQGSLCICHENWQSVLFTALNTASRMWDDFAMLQKSVANIFPQFSSRRISLLANRFVLFLDFQLNISREDYAKYFYHIHRIQRRAEYMDSDSELSIKVPRRSLVQAAGGAVLSMLRNAFTNRNSKIYCKED